LSTRCSAVTTRCPAGCSIIVPSPLLSTVLFAPRNRAGGFCLLTVALLTSPVLFALGFERHSPQDTSIGLPHWPSVQLRLESVIGTRRPIKYGDLTITYGNNLYRYSCPLGTTFITALDRQLFFRPPTPAHSSSDLVMAFG